MLSFEALLFFFLNWGEGGMCVSPFTGFSDAKKGDMVRFPQSQLLLVIMHDAVKRWPQLCTPFWVMLNLYIVKGMCCFTFLLAFCGRLPRQSVNSSVTTDDIVSRLAAVKALQQHKLRGAAPPEISRTLSRADVYNQSGTLGIIALYAFCFVYLF